MVAITLMSFTMATYVCFNVWSVRRRLLDEGTWQQKFSHTSSKISFARIRGEEVLVLRNLLLDLTLYRLHWGPLHQLSKPVDLLLSYPSNHLGFSDLLLEAALISIEGPA
ncbi:hypothetical protein Tco_0064039 [Tanacetum coccineum]